MKKLISNLPLFNTFVKAVSGLMFLNLLLLSIYAFNSCQSNQEEDKFVQADQSIQERFAISKEIASYHSDGLKFVYNQLKLQKNILQTSGDVKDEFIRNATAEYMSQEKVHSRMAQFENQIRLEELKISLRSDNQEIPESLIFLDNILENVKDQKSIESIESIIEQAFASAEFASFSETEQNEILLMFAVFLDSMGYWSENLADWLNMSNTNNFRSQQLNETDIEAMSAENKWKMYVFTAVCDMIGGNNGGTVGSIAGGLGGAAGGAVGGLFVGGVGAVPGAIAGGVGGIVAGGVSGFIAGAISGSSGCVTAYAYNDDEWALYEALYEALYQ